MDDQAPASQPPVFNLNAYSPAEIKEAVEKVGVKKAQSSLSGFVHAGGRSPAAASDLARSITPSSPATPELSFATARVMGGLVFSLGLALVLVGGAELFTGNNLIVMAWASGNVSTQEMLRNWVIVYLGNFVGAIGLGCPCLPFPSSRHEWRPHRLVDLELRPSRKIQPDVVTLFVKGSPV